MNNGQKRYSQQRAENVGVPTSDANLTFRTIKEAHAAGFHEKRPQDYGGEEFVIKGHTLIRNSAEAVTMTEWGRRGFRPIKGTQPHATIRTYQYRRG